MQSADLRNVILLGHGGTGKTTIAEAMLFNAKAIDRLGTIEDGNTTLDYDPEEIKRKYTISLATAPLDWKGKTINIIDAPGSINLLGEVIEGMAVTDCACLVLAGRIAVSAEQGWDRVYKGKIPRCIVFNKMNDETVNFNKLYSEVREQFGKTCFAIQIPIINVHKFVGYVDTLNMKAYTYGADGVTTPCEIPANLKDEAEQIHGQLCEAIAETNDDLMLKFFDGESFTDEEMAAGFTDAVKTCAITPILVSAATDNFGIRELSDFIVDTFPSPVECREKIAKNENGEAIMVPLRAEEAPVLFVFKTIVDPYIGRISLFKVVTGTVKNGDVLANIEKGTEERVGQLLVLKGKKQIPVNQLTAGDIGAIAKLANTSTNNTLSAKGSAVIMPPIEFPLPQHAQAIRAVKKGDDDKIAQTLVKIKGEDKTFSFGNNTETGEMIINAQGEKHLDIILAKLQSRYGLDAVLSTPKIAYRETIKKKVTEEATHKKQSGGSGQYGKVVIEFEPGDTDELVFEERVVGGAVPKQYFPSVEKGLQESVKHGVLAGYPVVKLKATLIDGKYHPVDSKEVAFVSAASMAYRQALPQANPVILEPIQSVKIVVPDKYMGDVIGDLNKRRGRVLGLNPMADNKQKIEAEVPYAEMFTYATDLRSIAHARATFTSDFVRYEEVPGNIAKDIIAAAQAENTDN